MEKFLIYTHVACGSIVLVLGIVIFMARKGTSFHRKIGRLYIAAMILVSFSSFQLLLFFRFSFFLLVIAQITLYSAFSALRIFRIQKENELKWIDKAMLLITFLFGLTLLFFGFYRLFVTPNSLFIGSLALLFGFLAFFGSFRDYVNYKKALAGQLDRIWWLTQHISSAGGSYIAAITAFAVQTGSSWITTPSFGWLAWVLPTVIGSPLIGLTVNRQKKKQTKTSLKMARTA